MIWYSLRYGINVYNYEGGGRGGGEEGWGGRGGGWSVKPKATFDMLMIEDDDMIQSEVHGSGGGASVAENHVWYADDRGRWYDTVWGTWEWGGGASVAENHVWYADDDDTVWGMRYPYIGPEMNFYFIRYSINCLLRPSMGPTKMAGFHKIRNTEGRTVYPKIHT